MIRFLEYFINALTSGSTYALIALGYTMVYGIMKMINFAHGEFFMVGAYVSYYCIVKFGLPLPIAIIISMILVSILGLAVERFAYRPLQKSKKMSALITAIAVSLLLQGLFNINAIGGEVFFPTSSREFIDKSLSLGSLSIKIIDLLIILSIVLGLIFVQIVMKKTNLGRAMRAVSINQEAAKLMGINTNKTIAATFIIGSSLAAIGGTLVGLKIITFGSTVGAIPGIKAFIAAVIGGIGVINGAVIGGLLIGFIETFSVAIDLSGWKEFIVYTSLILILFLKPNGLLGKKQDVKV